VIRVIKYRCHFQTIQNYVGIGFTFVKFGIHLADILGDDLVVELPRRGEQPQMPFGEVLAPLHQEVPALAIIHAPDFEHLFEGLILDLGVIDAFAPVLTLPGVDDEFEVVLIDMFLFLFAGGYGLECSESLS
jgi:hypothetical protein